MTLDILGSGDASKNIPYHLHPDESRTLDKKTGNSSGKKFETKWVSSRASLAFSRVHFRGTEIGLMTGLKGTVAVRATKWAYCPTVMHDSRTTTSLGPTTLIVGGSHAISRASRPTAIEWSQSKLRRSFKPLLMRLDMLGSTLIII